jgi:hypothetical protein
LPAGKLTWHPVSQTLEPDQFEDMVETCGVVPFGKSIFDVPDNRHMGEKRIVLKDHSDAALLRWDEDIGAEDGPSMYLHRSLSRFEPRDYPEGCCLATPGRPQKREQAALPNIEAEMVKSHARAEGLREVAGADCETVSR